MSALSSPGRSNRRRPHSEHPAASAFSQSLDDALSTLERDALLSTWLAADLLRTCLFVGRTEIADAAQLSPDDLYERYARGTGLLAQARAGELRVNRCALLPVEHTEHRASISPGEGECGTDFPPFGTAGAVRYGSTRDGLSTV